MRGRGLPIWFVCVLVVVLVPGAARSQLLYEDDFSDGDASVWWTLPNHTSYDASSGWVESGGVFRNGNTGANIAVEAVFSCGLSWGDYSVEVDFKADSFHVPSESGVFFRWNEKTIDPNESYAFCTLYRGGGLPDGTNYYVRLVGRTGANISQKSVVFPFSAGTWYRLRATAVGSQISCEVDGQPQTRLTIDGAPVQTTGTVALRSTHIRADFDNLRVESIGGGCEEWHEGFDFSALGVLAYWPFDDDSEDKSGNGNTGSWTGGALAPGAMFGGGYQYAQGEYYTVNGSSNLNSFNQAAWRPGST